MSTSRDVLVVNIIDDYLVKGICMKVGSFEWLSPHLQATVSVDRSTEAVSVQAKLNKLKMVQLLCPFHEAD